MPTLPNERILQHQQGKGQRMKTGKNTNRYWTKAVEPVYPDHEPDN